MSRFRSWRGNRARHSVNRQSKAVILRSSRGRRSLPSIVGASSSASLISGVCLSNNVAERGWQGLKIDLIELAGSDEGARRLVSPYTLIETVKLILVESLAYLAFVRVRRPDQEIRRTSAVAREGCRRSRRRRSGYRGGVDGDTDSKPKGQSRAPTFKPWCAACHWLGAVAR